MAPQNKTASGVTIKRLVFEPHSETIELFSGHNLGLGLRAETEDLGLSTDPRRLVAPCKNSCRTNTNHLFFWENTSLELGQIRKDACRKMFEIRLISSRKA